MAFLNGIFAIALVVLAAFAVVTGLVAGWFMIRALCVSSEKTKAVAKDTNPILGAVLYTYAWTKDISEGVFKWDLGKPMLTMLVIGIVVGVVVALDLSWKGITIWVLVIGAALQVIIGTYILAKMGINWANEIWLRILTVPCIFGKKAHGSREHVKETVAAVWNHHNDEVRRAAEANRKVVEEAMKRPENKKLMAGIMGEIASIARAGKSN